MNIECEQIRSDLSLEIAKDQVLSHSEMIEAVTKCLGKDKIRLLKYQTKPVMIDYCRGSSHEILTLLAVSYMGGNGQHELCRHRSQLKEWYKDLYTYYKELTDQNFHVIGVYHYDGNIIFVEFILDTYVERKLNNSAAWIYTNDLYQALRLGIFERIDKNNNKLIFIKYICLKDYLDKKATNLNDRLYSVFRNFNKNSNIFGKWTHITTAISSMHHSNNPNWKQTEWFGWYLEFLFQKYITDNHLESIIKFTAYSNKSKKVSESNKGKFDFDLWFVEEQFYGDLKSSDIEAKFTPGNDQVAFVQCINTYDRFWYVIYEAICHKTEEARQYRIDYISQFDPTVSQSHSSNSDNHRLLKEKVNFQRMYILELNRINFREVLTEFNQGRQYSGHERKAKFNIIKKNIDNFIVFSQTVDEIKEE